MKNVVKSSKLFFGYFNTLETQSASLMTKDLQKHIETTKSSDYFEFAKPLEKSIKGRGFLSVCISLMSLFLTRYSDVPKLQTFLDYEILNTVNLTNIFDRFKIARHIINLKL